MLEIDVYNTFLKIKYQKFSTIIQSIVNYVTFDYDIVKENSTSGIKEEKYYELYKYDNEIKQLIVPVGALEHTIRLCLNYGVKYKIVNRQIMQAEDLKYLKLAVDMKPRDYQELYINKLCDPSLSRFLLVDLKPGAGKTFIAVNVAIKLGKRIALIILPKYINKWIDDFWKYCKIPKNKIRVIQGLDTIENVINGQPIKEDVIILSVRTCTLYIEKYLKDPDVKPLTLFFNKAKIGTAILDEVHQETFAVSRVVMYSNIYKVIGLSATYMPNHTEERRLYKILFKDKERLSNLVTFDKYINIYGFKYLTHELNTNFVKNRVYGNYGYSHAKLEQIILAQNRYKEPYFEMVYEKLKLFFLNKDFIARDKCLIYFYTINACTIYTHWLRNRIRQEDKRYIRVARYVGPDPWENLMKNNIVITTLGSAGTAVDIPNLTTVINTVVVKSKKLNIQNIGRLRQIPNREVNYIYFFTDLHNSTEASRKSYFHSMAKTYIVDTYKLNIDSIPRTNRNFNKPKYTPEQRWEYFKKRNNYHINKYTKK